MKKRFSLVAMLSIFIMLLVSFNVVNAATNESYVCTLDRVGGDITGEVYVQLTCGGLPAGKWFNTNIESKKNYLAIGLVAATLGSALDIVVDDAATTSWPILKQMYVRP